MAPTCGNCGGVEFVWANEVKTGHAGGGLSLRPKGEVPIGTRICKGCGHADLFLHDLELLRKPHLWMPGEFFPISGTKPAESPPPMPTPAPPSAVPAVTVSTPSPTPSPSSSDPAAGAGNGLPAESRNPPLAQATPDEPSVASEASPPTTSPARPRGTRRKSSRAAAADASAAT